MGVLCESEVIAVCRPKSQLLYSYENSFWFADRELFSCSKLIVADAPKIARTFFFFSRSVTRGSDLVFMKVSTLSIYFLCTFLHSPHILFSKNPVFMRLFAEKKCIYKKVLTNHQHYTINTNYKHILRPNDRIFSSLLPLMVIFSKRCMTSLSLKIPQRSSMQRFFSTL